MSTPEVLCTVRERGWGGTRLTGASVKDHVASSSALLSSQRGRPHRDVLDSEPEEPSLGTLLASKRSSKDLALETF